MRAVIPTLLCLLLPILLIAEDTALPIGDIIKEKALSTDVDEPKKATPRLEDITLYEMNDSVRVVVRPSEKVDFKYDLLAGNAKDRIYIDLKNGLTAHGFTAPQVSADSFLKAIRLGKREEGTRIVLDTGKVEKYNVMVMDDPWRIVIDYIGARQTPPAEKKSGPAVAGPEKKSAEKQVAQKTAVAPTPEKKEKRFIIVVDPGHGGKDPGAIRKNLQEKDIVLALAKTVRRIAAKKHPDIEVVLTRDDDRFIPLEERAIIANRHDGDLFISIHTNTYKAKEIAGVELYHLNNRSDEYTDKLTRVENQITNTNSFLNTILVDMTMSLYIGDSQKFAESIGKRWQETLAPFETKIRDWRKGALFFVLVGARMPSLLVEVGFLSNPREAKILQKEKYLEALATGLLDAVAEVREKHTLAKDRP
ncbi:MAG TPA: N-acetylmuramoyl-L-alanine amidase [bacterium]|nr:N-acetylmuramoyl-L-alanine amidase [bacterium]